MSDTELHAVTGAFGYSGQYITRRLLARGHRVITLTNSPNRPDPFNGAVAARPLCFDDPGRLTESLAGVSVVYNTYWVRFDYKDFTHAAALEHTRTLFRCAKEAGVARIVHVSITNPSEDSPLPYFRGKAIVERELRASGLSHAILRPAILFGGADILVNNIAWGLRRFPVFGVFGNGRYRLRPIHVDDLAALAVEQGGARENAVIDAVGPEAFAYRDLVREVARIIGVRRLIVPVPTAIGYLAGKATGWLVGDVMLTRDEIRGLMAGLLDVDSPAAGEIKLTDWAREHADILGRHYASELARRQDRTRAY